jgi:opacity protein-like surface antigen
MRLRTLIPVLAVILFVPVLSASAQVGIYGKLDAVRFSKSSSNTENFGSTGWFYGPGAGVYYDFLHLGPASIGADVRGNYLFSNPNKYRSVLFGARLSVKPPALPVRPYVQGSVGIAGSNSPKVGLNGGQFENKFAYEVVAGVDYTIFPHVDWRTLELGYGRVSAVSSFAGTASNSVFLLSSGIVIRLP